MLEMLNLFKDRSMTLEEIGVYCLVGAAGAFLRMLVVRRGVIVFPKRWVEGDSYGVDLGFLTSIIIGAATAVIVDTSPWLGFFAAMSMPHLIEEIIKGRRSLKTPEKETKKK